MVTAWGALISKRGAGIGKATVAGCGGWVVGWMVVVVVWVGVCVCGVGWGGVGALGLRGFARPRRPCGMWAGLVPHAASKWPAPCCSHAAGDILLPLQRGLAGRAHARQAAVPTAAASAAGHLPCGSSGPATACASGAAGVCCVFRSDGKSHCSMPWV